MLSLIIFIAKGELHDDCTVLWASAYPQIPDGKPPL